MQLRVRSRFTHPSCPRGRPETGRRLAGDSRECGARITSLRTHTERSKIPRTSCGRTTHADTQICCAISNTQESTQDAREMTASSVPVAKHAQSASSTANLVSSAVDPIVVPCPNCSLDSSCLRSLCTVTSIGNVNGSRNSTSRVRVDIPDGLWMIVEN